MNTPAILDKDLVEAIRKYPDSNRMIFGTNSNKSPEPIQVKKLILMLIGAKILRHYPVRKEKSPGKFEVTIYGALAFVKGNPTQLALSNDSYWNLLPLKD